MPLPYNKRLKYFARELRKNMTDAEQFFWAKVRRKQLKSYQFYRQKNIGSYIVDFYCPSAKLIIEIDWGQHLTGDGMAKDQERDQYLERLGLKVLRFSDTDVFKDTEGVLERILENL